MNPKFGTWQPIETAPKDGTEFIAYCPDKSETKLRVLRFDGDCFLAHNSFVSDPTHWMPLPPGPEGEND